MSTTDNPPQPPPPPPQLPSPEAYLQRYWPVGTLAFGVVLWFLTIDRAYHPGTDNSPPVTVNVLALYASMMSIGLAATEIVRRKWSWPWTRLTGSALTAAVVLTWGYFDRHERRWQRDNVRYTDKHHRWSDKLTYRKIDFYKSAEAAIEDRYGIKEDFSLEGPMAGTGKPHGHWKWQLGLDHWPDAIRSNEPYQKPRFYWYGDEVSEGEWHLRNR